MDPDALPGLARHLASAALQDSPAALAAAWVDQTITLQLDGTGYTRPTQALGAHLRRSFLGALSPGASEAARSNLPCPWDPPCTLDVFCREQLRGPAGDGLPKPYVLAVERNNASLIVHLRIFGLANDWAHAAEDALASGLRSILPWDRLGAQVPTFSARDIRLHHIAPQPAPYAVRLRLLSPMDISGRDVAAEPWTILARMIRRVDGVSRWCGVGLDPEVSRRLSLSCRALHYDLSGLRTGTRHAANRKAERRRDPVMTGTCEIAGDLSDLWPMLQIAERCHIGRHAVEGLGRIELVLPG